MYIFLKRVKRLIQKTKELYVYYALHRYSINLIQMKLEAGIQNDKDLVIVGQQITQYSLDN